MSAQCPDGGACFHDCESSCWRVSTCLPLSEYGWDWTDEDKAANPPEERTRIEDVIIGD